MSPTKKTRSLVPVKSRPPAAPPRRAVAALTEAHEGYTSWLSELKSRISEGRRRAAVAVNTELVQLYWEIGNSILEKQKTQKWGSGVIDKLGHDLRTAFPEMHGFSRANLMYMRAFAEAWPDEAILQQPVGQLSWGANIVLLTKVKTAKARRFYAAQALEHGWSRSVLMHQIESQLLERTGKAATNFDRHLPEPHATQATAALKDPYHFDFLGVGTEADERAIETALTSQITTFLLELGAGFAFVGRQVHVEVGGDDFHIDLLFYHLGLRCYVVVELKATEFKPDHTGQLGFYLSAVDAQIRNDLDNPTIGLLLCKTKNRMVVEYALLAAKNPIGVAEYQLVQSLPKQLKSSLPSTEQIERELGAPAVAGSSPKKKPSRTRGRR